MNSIRLIAIVTAIGIAAIVSSAPADVISVHAFYNDGTSVGTYNDGVTDSSTAGVMPEAGTTWNNDNVYTNGTNTINLLNSSGVQVTNGVNDATFSINADDPLNFSSTVTPLSHWSPAASTANEQLYAAGLYKYNTITLSNIPYSSYNVYVYLQGTTGYNYEVGDSGSGENLWYQGDNSGGAENTLTGFTLVPSTATSSGSAVKGNYMVFPETSSSDTITLDSTTNGNNNFFGLQIVSTPEPASLGLFALGATAALSRRRRTNR